MHRIWSLGIGLLLLLPPHLLAQGAANPNTATAAETPAPLLDLDRYIAMLANAGRHLREFADAMPADRYDFRPEPGMRTFAGQLMHIAWATAGFTNAAIGTSGVRVPDSTVAGRDREEIIRVVEAVFSDAITALRAVEPERLAQPVPWVGPMFDAESMPAGQVLLVSRDHITHHRGQLITYLRMNGVSPPVYVGWW